MRERKKNPCLLGGEKADDIAYVRADGTPVIYGEAWPELFPPVAEVVRTASDEA